MTFRTGLILFLKEMYMKTKTVRMVRLGVLLLIIQLISLSFVSVNVNAVDWTEYQNTSTNNGVT